MNNSINPQNGASSRWDGRLSANAGGQTTLLTKGYLLIGDSAFIGKVLAEVNPQPQNK